MSNSIREMNFMNRFQTGDVITDGTYYAIILKTEIIHNKKLYYTTLWINYYNKISEHSEKELQHYKIL